MGGRGGAEGDMVAGTVPGIPWVQLFIFEHMGVVHLNRIHINFDSNLLIR